MEPLVYSVWIALGWIPALAVTRVTRRGLLFGVHVGTGVNPEARRAVAGGWLRNFLLVCLAAAVAGLTRFGALAPLPASLVAAAILVVGAVLAYQLSHLQARILARPPASPEDLAAAGQAWSRDVFPLAASLLVIAGAAVGVLYAVAVFDALPERIPVHFDGAGNPDAWAPRSWGRVLFSPLMSLATGGVLAVMAWVSVRTDFGRGRARAGVSPAAREHLQGSMARFLSAMAVLVAVLMTLLSIGSLRTALGAASGLGRGPIVVVLVLLVFALAGAAIMTRASRRAGGGEHYKGGLLYVNREDPAVFVPKRIGLGWTLNFGNPVAYLVLLALLAIPLVTVLLIGRSRS